METNKKTNEDNEEKIIAILKPSVARGRGIYFWIPKDQVDLIDIDFKYKVTIEKFKKIED